MLTALSNSTSPPTFDRVRMQCRGGRVLQAENEQLKETAIGGVPDAIEWRKGEGRVSWCLVAKDTSARTKHKGPSSSTSKVAP